jgi:penicillin-binding protein 1B
VSESEKDVESSVEVPSEQEESSRRFFDRPHVRRVGIALLAAVACCLAVTGYYYLKFARLIDRRLRAGAFAQSLNIYAAPETIALGDAISPEQIAARLRRSGYTTSARNPVGRYKVESDAVEIYPGPESYFGPEPAVLHFSRGRLSKIISLGDNTERTEYELEPQLITNLSDKNREKRRIIHYGDIPPPLVHAVVAVEDKRFFQHGGLDLLRIGKAAWVDLREGRKEQGASTLSMQLGRNIWLDAGKSFKRKLAEILITMHLEHKLTKQQIFEDYGNQVYLGRRGTFSINGFGEAAREYFGKDAGQLSIDESALLAGMIQRPSYYNPFRFPERARERRNLVLALMRDQGYLTPTEFAQAAAAPIHLSATGDSDSLEAQYFIDLVNEELPSLLDDSGVRSNRVYTTLDTHLQHAAEEAVHAGMQLVDQQLARRHQKEKPPPNQPQVALIALDPHTGEIKALVGGRSYGSSQLDHVLAERQPGSSFKPFVYAAALDTAVEGGSRIFTPASTVADQPTTFLYDNQVYTPGNFHQQFLGTVTLRTALAHSLNVATVRLAQMVGYPGVVAMALRAGLPGTIRATPAVALGAYEATPLQIAGAYTVFANDGVWVRPSLISSVRGKDGRVTWSEKPESRRALDPRVAYLMVNLLQEVMRSGTAAGVRARGFTAPAAGKTGTSRDGWFAGFTSELLCVVWVGFDDNRDLGLEGARSALPIWADFMKKALQFPEYSDAKPFRAPDGIITAEICSESGQLAAPTCPLTRDEVFIDGTQPAVECELHTGTPAQVLVNGNADRVLIPVPDQPQPPN